MSNRRIIRNNEVIKSTTKEHTTMNTTTQTTMAAAMAQAGMETIDRTETAFSSPRVAQSVGFAISAEYGKAATRIQKAAAGKTRADELPTLKAEIGECLRKLAWGIDNIPDQMRPIEECITEWAGGGFSRPATDNDVAEVANALGISSEQARMTADANRLNRTNYLAVRRQGQAEPMIAIIQRELGKIDPEEAVEPSNDIILAACQKAFQNAVLWGDWAEATLAKSDMVYHCGANPEMPAVDEGMQAKAERIRQELSRRQAEQAQKDAEALMSFDLDNLTA